MIFVAPNITEVGAITIEASETQNSEADLLNQPASVLGERIRQQLLE